MIEHHPVAQHPWTTHLPKQENHYHLLLMQATVESDLALFGLGDDLPALERQLETMQGPARLAPLVELAWYLRQRDCKRALALADEADTLLHPTAGNETDHCRRRHAARLLLLRSEIKLLFAGLDESDRMVQAAAQAFAELDDPLGMGDACWMQATLALDRGGMAQACKILHQAWDHYDRYGLDPLRLDACVARRLTYEAFQDPLAAGIKLRDVYALEVVHPPAVAAWVATARATVAGLTDDPATAIQQFMQAHHDALASGQVRQALVMLANAIEAFAKLGDLDAALQWSKHALALAHASGWPGTLGVTLMQAGNVMRLLSRYPEARKYLQEALAAAAALSNSRVYELVLAALGDLEQDLGQYAAALASFTELEGRFKRQMEPDQMITAWRGQASALCQLDRVEEAHAKAIAALTLARDTNHAEPQVHVLRILAQIHQKYALPPPPHMVAPTASLHYLQCALDVAVSMEGYAPPADLLTQLALAYADCGDYHAAYEHSQLAAAARDKLYAEQTQTRALAMQIHSQLQRAQAEVDHHRELANSLRETAATLEVLGTIGRAVTASLDARAVFETLHRHAHALLDATSFAVYLLDREHNVLTTAFGREGGADWPVRSVALDSPTSRFARCARERRELVIHLEPHEMQDHIPGTLPTRSLLYAPLLIGERLLGVMTIQSSQYNAYGERERYIFQSLSAYGAIAIDNSEAYAVAAQAQRRADQALHDLRQTQARLLEQNQELERLAITDQLTGLNNRLRLDQALRDERQRHHRHGGSFCVLMIDVDHFKSVNDNYGHPAGDQVLVGIAHALVQKSRADDLVGRWGGEEFLVVCHETAIDGAMTLGEKLRLAVQALAFEGIGKQSVSVGVAQYRAEENLTEMLTRADAALYRAKQGGRNRVESGQFPDF